MRKSLILPLALISPMALSKHNCSGTVSNVDVSSSGNVHVSISGVGDGNVLCSLESTMGYYKPESCKAVLSLALTAKMSGKNLRVYFENDTDTSCLKGNWRDFSSSGYQLYHLRIEG